MPAGGAPASVGSGLTVIVTVSWLFEPGIAATSVTCIGDVIPDGAVYVVLVPVGDDSVPHPVPLHDAPVNDHATSKLPLKLAVTGMDCPASRTNEVAERLEIPPPAYPPPPHPLSSRESITANTKNMRLPRDASLPALSIERDIVCSASNSLSWWTGILCGITMGNLASVNCFVHWGSTSRIPRC